jgi:hypothetical protein
MEIRSRYRIKRYNYRERDASNDKNGTPAALVPPFSSFLTSPCAAYLVLPLRKVARRHACTLMKP